MRRRSDPSLAEDKERAKRVRPANSQSGQRSEESSCAGVVTECFASVRKEIDVARAENKTSAELKRVFPEFVLMMAGVVRSLSSFCIIAAQEMQEIGGLQLRCAIGLTLFVYEERESNGSFLAKLPGVNGVAEANCCENCAFLTKGLFVFAQLRDVLTAKNSAVVTQENYDGRSFIPQGSETRLAVVAIRKRYKGEFIAEGGFHGSSILLSAFLAVKRPSLALID
jgi:hypothetical protein